jgi:hypothetical protein
MEPYVNPIGSFRTDYSEPKLCPRCMTNTLPIGYPGALSRTDNKTEICSPCGTQEGLEDWLDGGHRPQTAWAWPVR